MNSITKITEEYISNHPSIKDCLKNDLINFSSLSRRLAEELDLNLKKNFDAILIACRRYQRKLKNEEVLENKILKILKDLNLRLVGKSSISLFSPFIQKKLPLTLTKFFYLIEKVIPKKYLVDVYWKVEKV